MPLIPFPVSVTNEKERNLALARLILWMNLSVFAATVLFFFIQPNDGQLFQLSLSYFAVLLVAYVLVRTGLFKVAGYVLIFSTMAFVFADTVMFEKTVASAANAALALIVPFSLLIFPRNEAIFLCLLIPVYIFSFFGLDQSGYFWPSNSSYLDLIEILTALSLFGYSFYYAIHWARAAQLRRTTEIEHELERLFENVPIGLFRTTLDGVQVKANRLLWQLEGYSSEEESLNDPFDIATEWYVDPNRRDQFIQAIQENGQVVDFESEIYQRSTRKKIWISESAYAVRDENGEILFFEGSIRDITSQKRAEIKNIQQSERLQALAKQLRGITDSARDVILIADRAGVISFANPATKQMFGYDYKELLGQKIDIFVEESQKEKFWRSIVRAASSIDVKKALPLQITGIRKNGERVVTEMSMSRSEDADGKIEFIGIIRDITEKEKTAEFLNHMQRLDSLGLLAGGIAHDFNNLLVAILGQTSLAMRKLPDDSPALSNLEKAKGAGDRAAELCRQLLAYSGKGHFEIQKVNLSELIAKNMHLHHIAVPSEIELITRLSFDVPEFLGDPSQIQQVIMNLILNAVDSFEGGAGKIELVTGARKIELKDSLIWTRSGRPLRPGHYVTMRVSDNGSGIEEAILDRIFDPFFSTKDTGHGLGLAGVQGIVRGHNGGMLVNSKVGKGTTFTVYFPELIEDE